MKPLLRTSLSPEALAIMLTTVKDSLTEDVTSYVDSFCGAAEVPFELELAHCTLNDSNPFIFNFYTQVKSGDFLKNGWVIDRGTDFLSWAGNRSKFNELIFPLVTPFNGWPEVRAKLEKLIASDLEKAVRIAQLTFYLIHVGRNFRFGTTGTLISRYNRREEDIRLPEVDWAAAAALMQNWELQNHDTYDCLEDYTLELKSLSATDQLPLTGKNLVCVAKIDTQYYVRIFDNTEKKVVDKSQNEFPLDVNLVEVLDAAFASQPIDDHAKGELILKVTSSLGYTRLEVAEDVLLMVNAPEAYRLQWDAVAWDPAAHENLIKWIQRHPGKTIVCHPENDAIATLYTTHLIQNNQTGGDVSPTPPNDQDNPIERDIQPAPSNRVFHVLPR
ncbi:MAG: hypothetical protein F6K11_13745 [Leptolyngbya sp. SIO3F4]|nr:hypothetical protein [Leptolyngbya sp. SIO3F4]